MGPSLNVVSVVMLILITFIGLVIVKYSQNYLQGEPRRYRYYAALTGVLLSVAVTVTADHLLVFLAGWVAISFSLHALLRFYPDRPRAALAAHKKFLFARLAELFLLAAFLLLHHEHGTWQISVIAQHYLDNDASTAGQWAAVLIAMAALIKCAQLPFHGWLMQVVEAPTPVSALLHAGVVNMGGYLLIVFGPLLLQSTSAQALVIAVAGASVVLAALSMATRISVKVRLAWSTCAQMGFMLIECAMGLFELALLHLVAHSCYKAFAFLNSGSAVQAYRLTQMSPAAAVRAWVWFPALLVGAGLAGAGALASGGQGPAGPWVLLGLALAVLVAQRSSVAVKGGMLYATFVAALIAALYVGQKVLFGHWVHGVPVAVGLWADIALIALTALLFAGHLLLVHGPDTPLGRNFQRWLFAGLYLDEWATRITLRVWPVQLPVPSRSRGTHFARVEGVTP
ncbi:NADH-quinone oxidoreductase subunit L [Pusillimonas sp. NJUB218]|uniref:NADH-quinone oxidoreductase subunit L n=1 Tax=Pusillimonas sp. NJUB218 TaxID=2023230 RepID=UPI000F4BA7B1|nr:NADH-quinone oxidoreductase subunit L [Pusillimonas sp. NJUB218]ROT44703.1 hypothetical protein CHR62_11830 [Pusillimonas sp. NJUB218]